jgi:hypothetical protein
MKRYDVVTMKAVQSAVFCRGGLVAVMAGCGMAWLSAGCGSAPVEETPLDKAACDVFESGQVTKVDAAPIGSPPPVVTDDGRQYQVALPPTSGARGGRVLVEVDIERTYVFFADAVVSMVIREGEAPAQGPDPGQGRLNTCARSVSRVEFTLDPGVYFLELGPTNLPSVGLVVMRK